MTPVPSFSATAGVWQNFYLLVGAASATLIGLMFVAVTFGARIVTKETQVSARAFLDPTFTHFVQVLVTACMMTIPTMGSTVLGILLLAIGALRGAALVRVFRHMSLAQRIHHDIELSDWLTGVALPLVCFLLLGGTGAAFLTGHDGAFNALAIATVAVLLNGIYGAWELVVWMAVTRRRAK